MTPDTQLREFRFEFSDGFFVRLIGSAPYSFGSDAEGNAEITAHLQVSEVLERGSIYDKQGAD